MIQDNDTFGHKSTYAGKAVFTPFFGAPPDALYTAPFMYSDAFFEHSAFEPDASLAVMSAAACAASYNCVHPANGEWNDIVGSLTAKGYKGLGGNDTWVLRLLRSMNFTDLRTFNYYSASEQQPSFRVGFALGRRSVMLGGRKTNIIAAFIRGTTGGEWYSNFKLDRDEKKHVGFLRAQSDVSSAILNYIAKLCPEAQRNVLWITGHSRGAAVANLAANTLMHQPQFEGGDVYCYTFATPCTTLRPAAYKNIRNYVSDADFITRMPLEKWGFGRFGADEHLNMAERPVTYRLMQENYFEITGRRFSGFALNQSGKTAVDACVAEFEKAAPDLDAYFDGVGGQSSGLQFMSAVEDVMAKGGIIDKLNFLSMGKKEPVFARIKMFFATYSNINPLVLYEHSPETYLAWCMALKGRG